MGILPAIGSGSLSEPKDAGLDMNRMWAIGLAILATAPAMTLAANRATAQPADQPEKINADFVASGFLSSHPDVLYRQFGLDLLHRGQHERGINALLRAARYADKPSQAVIAEGYWQGQFGLPRDPSAAYAWMDLAAERGYPELLVLRERYWIALSENERSRALELGPSIYMQYGDDVARPKLAKVLQRGIREVTGSRTGFGGNLTIVGSLPGGGSGAPTVMNETTMVPSTLIPGSKFYAPALWQPRLYFQQQDKDWRDRLGPSLYPNITIGAPTMAR